MALPAIPNQGFDPDSDDKGPSRTYLKALLSEVKSVLKRTVTKEKFNAAMRKARAKAGGSFKARRKKKTYVAKKQANYYEPGLAPKLPKEDPAVAFAVDGGELAQRCGNCRFFYPSTCCLVEGTIEQNDLCSLWRDRIDFSFDEPKELAAICASQKDTGRGKFALFMGFEFKEVEAGAVQWIPFLPIPGEYVHPQYGMIVITSERNHRFVENFRAGVYQKSIPIDAEHELKVSGALGYVEKMRQNEDGSVDAQVKWTDRGAQMLNEDRFRYVSPEWYDEWTDPATATVHKDVAIGGALTTRPFFKEKALRPLLAASEFIKVPGRSPQIDAVEFRRKETRKMTTENKKPGLLEKFMTAFGYKPGEEAQLSADLGSLIPPPGVAGQDPPAPPVVVTPPVAAAPAPAPTETALPQAASERITAAESRAQKAEQEAKTAREETAKIAKELRHRRFSDMVMGKTAASPHRWFGGDETRITEVENLADKLGEDSAEFKAYCAREAQVAASMNAQGKVFGNLGYTGDSEVDSNESKVNVEAKKLMSENPREFPTIEQARVAVRERNPALRSAR